MRFLHAAEAMSRSNALANMIATANGPTPIPVAEFLYETGFYHTEVDNLARDPNGNEVLKTLKRSPAWQQLTSMEDALAQRAVTPPSTASSSSPGKPSTPPPLPHTGMAQRRHRGEPRADRRLERGQQSDAESGRGQGRR
jgi:hypothetical protein